jgi:hypothetical protein
MARGPLSAEGWRRTDPILDGRLPIETLRRAEEAAGRST